ncbi:MAG: hypothetical protein IJH50_01425 [Kiritimatiellae bacterium]|nr:hypothetical protein [Kiritimatiellia bacterium]
MNIKSIVVAASLMALCASASDVSYPYASGDTSLGDGAVVLTYEEGTTDVKTLTATPTDGGTVSITGDAMTFADDAAITLSTSGTVSFASMVTTLGKLSLSRSDGAYVVWTGKALTPSTTASGVEVFAGLNRDTDLEHSSIVFVGGADGPCPGRFHYVSGPSSGIYTLNNVRPDYTYSIRPQLSGNSPITGVRCITGSRSQQFVEYPDGSLWNSKGAEHYCGESQAVPGGTRIGNTSDLKLTKIIVRKKGMSEKVWVRFDGGVALGGETSVGAGVEAVIGASEGDGAVTLACPITGNGDVRIATSTATTAFAGTSYFEPFINTSWQILATNRSLSALTSLSAHMLGGSHNYVAYADVGGTPTDAYYIKYNPDSNTATCQFQYWTGSGLKFVKAQLRQNGVNVEIKGVAAGYYTNSQYNYNNNEPHDFDNDSNNANFATSATASGYGIHYITATFAGATGMGVARLESTMNAMFGSILTFDGSNGPLHVTVTNQNAFPICGVVNVGTNADVALRVKGLGLTSGVSGGTSKIVVQRGGILSRGGGANGQIGTYQDFVLDGGTYESIDYNVYQSYITLMNGAHMIGASPPRTVYSYSPQYWRVRGTSPSFIDNGINIYGSGTASGGESKRFRIDVADVTGDDDVDCTVSKIFHNDGNQQRFSYFRFEKLGAGTMLLAGSGLAVKLETFVSGGTFLLGASGIATNEFVLCGGNLAVAANVTNNIGALTVSNACTIAVGTGGSLSFASFTADEGLQPKAITIDAPLEGNVIKFDTTLTDEERNLFRWKDSAAPTGARRVDQDANGYLHPHSGGMLIFIK